MAIVNGTDAADFLRGTAGEANSIFAYSGDDTIDGAELGDHINGGNGDDDIYGFQGDNHVVGDDGDDDIEVGNGNDYVDAGDGHDDVKLRAGDDTVYGGDGDDDVDAYGALGETNIIFLEEGDDGVFAGPGVDLIDGGRGQDLVFYGYSTAGVTVNLRSGTGTGGAAQGDTFRLVEDVNGTIYNDVLIGNGVSNILAGFDSNDYINGGIGADFLYGGTEVDTLAYVGSFAGVAVNLATGTATGGDALGDEFYEFENLLGSSFADRLTGNGIANRLTGGDGNDSLFGAVGADILTGGLGADRFIYGANSQSTPAAAGRDLITDFSLLGDDRIDLSLIDANTAAIGNQAFGFIGAAAFSGVNGQVRYQQFGGSTLVYADVNGDRVADLGIGLTGPLALTGGDFVL